MGQRVELGQEDGPLPDLTENPRKSKSPRRDKSSEGPKAGQPSVYSQAGGLWPLSSRPVVVFSLRLQATVTALQKRLTVTYRNPRAKETPPATGDLRRHLHNARKDRVEQLGGAKNTFIYRRLCGRELGKRQIYWWQCQG